MSADPRVTTEAQLARLTAQVEGIGHEIRDLRTTATQTLQQTTRTNGRVTATEMRVREIEIRAEERDRAAERAAEERSRADARREKRQARRDRWLIALAGIAATASVAIVGWVLSAG